MLSCDGNNLPSTPESVNQKLVIYIAELWAGNLVGGTNKNRIGMGITSGK